MITEEFRVKYHSGVLISKPCRPEQKTVNANDIIVDENWNAESKDFWNHHGRSKEEYMDFIASGEAEKQKPIDVYKCDDKYVLVSDGNHRVAAAQELDADVKVNITGEYFEKGQEQDDSPPSSTTSMGNDKMGKISRQLTQFRRDHGEPGTTLPAAHDHNITPENERASVREQIRENQNEHQNNIIQEND